jgi:hypothetical protein
LNSMDQDSRDLNFRAVVSTENTTFYNPPADTMNKPYIDIVVARESSRLNNLKLQKNAWLTQLLSKKMMVRRLNETTWYCVLGLTAGDVAWCWELIQDKDTPSLWLPLVPVDSKPVAISILDPYDWVAMPIAIKSPVHVAIAKTKIDVQPSAMIDLPASSTFGRLYITIVPQDVERTLFECVARCAFHLLPASYMHLIILFLEKPKPPTNDPVELVAYLAKLLIPDCDDILLIKICRKRLIYFEAEAADLTKVLELEYVLDLFTPSDREVLDTEIKNAKYLRSLRDNYKASFIKFKAVSDTSQLACNHINGTHKSYCTHVLLVWCVVCRVAW